MTGRVLSDAEIDAAWRPWTPDEVARRLSSVTAPWCVAAGWALELFCDSAARAHHDLEIAVPAARFEEIEAALPGFAWDVVGDGRVWPYPQERAEHFQTWLRDPASGDYHLDVFREPHVDDRWVCRRAPSITLPYSELILHTRAGIPYLAPEVVLLFKAKHLRPKDDIDFARVSGAMGTARRSLLRDWLRLVHPGHRWIAEL